MNIVKTERRAVRRDPGHRRSRAVRQRRADGPAGAGRQGHQRADRQAARDRRTDPGPLDSPRLRWALLIATTNPNKIREIRPLLAGQSLSLSRLADMAPIPEPEESGATFWENARIKALAYAGGSGLMAVAEDSGLVIDAMDGEPGVRRRGSSAPAASYPDGSRKSSAASKAAAQRARFVTALAVARGNDNPVRDGNSRRGRNRRGACRRPRLRLRSDLLVSAVRRTTAQLPDADKAVISHRARAIPRSAPMAGP